MGLGFGIVLMVAGAIMKWGLTTDQTSDFNVDTIGTILFVIGIIAALTALALSADWQQWGAGRTRRRTVTYDREGMPAAVPPAVAVPAQVPVAQAPVAPVAAQPGYGYPVAGQPVYPAAPVVPGAQVDAYGRPVAQREVVQEEIRDSRF